MTTSNQLLYAHFKVTHHPVRTANKSDISRISRSALQAVNQPAVEDTFFLLKRPEARRDTGARTTFGVRGRACTTLRTLIFATFIGLRAWSQTTNSNLTISLTTTELRDRLYDAGAAAALTQAPVHTAVIHLMDEALRRNPGALSALDATQVMQRMIAAMTNDFGARPHLSVQDLVGRALPYLQEELTNRVSATNASRIMMVCTTSVLFEQQGDFPATYFNLTTAFPTPIAYTNASTTGTASGVGSLFRQVGSSIVASALPERIRTSADPAFRTAATSIVASIAQITPQDNLDDIVALVPGFATSALVSNLVNGAHAAGLVLTNVEGVLIDLTNVLSGIHQLVQANASGLSSIDTIQADEASQIISSNLSQGIAIAQPLVNLTSTLLKMGGDLKLAQDFATMGGVAIQIAQGVKGMADAVHGFEAADSLFSFAGAAASVNFIGAALDICNIFGGGSGANSDQVVYNQILDVRQDIASLRQDMDSRFDQVDSELTNIMGRIDFELSLITNGFTTIEGHLEQIQNNLIDLQGQVQRIESEVYSWLYDIQQADLKKLLHDSLGFEAQNGFRMLYSGGGPEGDFVSFQQGYYTWSVINSFESLYQPPGISDLYTRLTTWTNAEANVSWINNFIPTLGLPAPNPFVGSLANPRVWCMAANGYVEMCLENPDYFRIDPTTVLNEIIPVGNDLQTFLTGLIVSGGSPNTNLWIAACTNYADLIQGFTNAIQASLDLYNNTNGLPAGFNPFTDQCLSLITAQQTEMVDGYYPTSSVVSVSAVACSPTPDGMPIYFLDQNTLRSLDSNGMITTLAGSSNGVAGFRDGPNALFNAPQALVVGSNGWVYISDTGNHAIRAYGDNGLATLAGYLPGTNNATPVAGAGNGTNGTARFNSPRGLVLDSQGNMLVADTGNHAVRKVTPTGIVTTFAGQLGLGGRRDGPASVAQFWTPDGLALDTKGLVYVTDRITRTVRVIDTNGMVSSYPNSPGLSTLVFPFLLTENSSPLPSSAFAYQLSDVAAGGEPQVLDQEPFFYYYQPHNHALGLYVNGKVSAWGNNYYNQCLVPMTLTNFTAVSPGATSDVAVAVSAGGSSSLAVTGNGVLRAWGNDLTGLANQTIGPYNRIQGIAAGTTVFEHSLPPQSQFAFGDSIAIVNYTNVLSWHMNSSGDVNLDPDLYAVGIAAGLGHSLVLGGSGSVFALGTGTYTTQGFSQGVPNIFVSSDTFVVSQMPPGLTNIVAISDSYAHALALKSDGTVVAWGYNPAGECDVPSGLSNVVAVAAGRGVNLVPTLLSTNGTTMAAIPTGSHSLALRSDGTVVAWGDNEYGQTNVPAGLSNVVAISAGSGISFALKRDGTVASWGDATYGLVGVHPPGQTQLIDTPLTNAAVQQLTAATITPDGRLLVADGFGLRSFGYSGRLQRLAAAHLINDMVNPNTQLYSAGNALEGWHLFLNTLATYVLGDALANDDSLHELLFGKDSLLDTASVSSFLDALTQTANWSSGQFDFGSMGLEQVALLQSRILAAVTNLAQQRTPGNLPMVTDTLNRLNLLLSTHDSQMPPPVLDSASGTNQVLAIMLNGYPYVHYAVETSLDLVNWATNSGVVGDGNTVHANTGGTTAGFYRAIQVQ